MNDKSFRFFITLIIAAAGGFLFQILHAPIAWLLGPMTAVFLGARFIKTTLFWPSSIRNTGLIIVGYSIGLSFTIAAVRQIFTKLPSMLLMTVLLVLFCAGIAYFVSKLTGVDYPTVLTGSIPGGLSQMITFAEEMKGIDITTVTFLQVARLMMIIFFVPFLVLGPLFKQTSVLDDRGATNTAHLTMGHLPELLLFALICTISAFLGKKLRFPTPFLLGPLLGTAIMTITGLHGPVLTPTILDISQFLIGGYIGLLLKPEKLEHKTKIITLALISGMVMILGSLGLSFILVFIYRLKPSTSFLSVAPGGMDQMGILAHEIGADLSMVSGFQLFRLFFIYFAVPPMLRLFFKMAKRKETVEE